jgi:short-subunit dehydrogenase
MHWQDAVVVVTGGSSGIGLEVARAAARRGARVGLVARSPEALDQACSQIPGATGAPADVADDAQLRAAMTVLTSRLGEVDVLVCSAGIGRYGPFQATTEADAERLVRVNLLGSINAARSVLDSMIRRKRGHLVFLGSIAGHVGVPFEALYSATKFGIAGFAEALAGEVAVDGIGVSVVSPGPVDTPFFDARGHPYTRRRPRPADPAEIAAAVVRAVDRKKPESIVPGRLRGAVVVRALAPSVYRWGARRATRCRGGQTALPLMARQHCH